MQMTENLFYGTIIGRTGNVSGTFETVYSIQDPIIYKRRGRSISKKRKEKSSGRSRI
ncbi:hypothetical protein ACB092_03G023400 [Castanea dentata]